MHPELGGSARNHLTGAETVWEVGGDVRNIWLGRDHLFIVLADRLVQVPYGKTMVPAGAA